MNNYLIFGVLTCVAIGGIGVGQWLAKPVYCEDSTGYKWLAGTEHGRSVRTRYICHVAHSESFECRHSQGCVDGR